VAPIRTATPSTRFADENATTLGTWSSVVSEGSRRDAVFEQPDYSWGPGEVFRCNTTQIFILAAAMQELVARQEGRDVRLWDLMMREVFEPIGIRHFPMMHTIETGDAQGVPLMGIGLYPTVDDVAKIATLVQNGGRRAGATAERPGPRRRAVSRPSRPSHR
jgi:hypothetical protein